MEEWMVDPPPPLFPSPSAGFATRFLSMDAVPVFFWGLLDLDFFITFFPFVFLPFAFPFVVFFAVCAVFAVVLVCPDVVLLGVSSTSANVSISLD